MSKAAHHINTQRTDPKPEALNPRPQALNQEVWSILDGKCGRAVSMERLGNYLWIVRVRGCRSWVVYIVLIVITMRSSTTNTNNKKNNRIHIKSP